MTANLVKSTGLAPHQIEQIGQLAQTCNAFENLTMKLNWSWLNNRPIDETNDFLYTVNGELAGYLALYIFTQSEAEVSVMVHPNFRRQGIFKTLLTAARAEVAQRGIPDLLFICEQTSPAGAAAMRAIGSLYEFSEYRMDLRAAVPPFPTAANLNLRPAQLDDIPIMAQLDYLCFNMPVEKTIIQLEQEITNGRRKTALVATIDNAVIGKLNVLHVGPEDVYIGAFCLRPEYRGQGYGKTILSRTVAELQAMGHQRISLEVATSNSNALLVYQRCGFETTTGYDYYRLPALS